MTTVLWIDSSVMCFQSRRYVTHGDGRNVLKEKATQIQQRILEKRVSLEYPSKGIYVGGIGAYITRQKFSSG